MASEAGVTIGTLLGLTWDLMTANPLLTLFLGASLVSLGFAFFKRIKKVAK